jgi:hypothetical protein
MTPPSLSSAAQILEQPAIAALSTYSLMERLPWYGVYAFHVPYCAYLGLKYGGFTLPTISNPGLDASGLTKESKSQLFNLLGSVGRAHLPNFITLEAGSDLTVAVDGMKMAGLSFPVVLKPDIGRRGFGVKIIENVTELADHLSRFRQGTKLLLQRYAPGPGEAGIFYVRLPSEPRGRIISLALKHFPEVTGDGVATLRELILQHPRAKAFTKVYFKRHEHALDRILASGERLKLVSLGNHVRGCACEDACHLVTPTMESVFDRIAQEIPGFFVGRFDVRFESIEKLRAGTGFSIVEYNGASGEPIHMWDPRTKVLDTFAGLFSHVRYLYAIGAENLTRGARPMSTMTIVRRHFEELALLRSYPDTE